jgi:hypothetical protein
LMKASRIGDCRPNAFSVGLSVLAMIGLQSWLRTKYGLLTY